jgi:hypothetical protein
MYEIKQELRTSLYLTRKAEALLGVLRFFHDRNAPLHRRLQFLAQGDFWEWEMDNLIYSFSNFQERSKTWQSSDRAVGTLGIAVDAKTASKVRWRLGHWQHKDATRRVAPVELLKEAVDLWNEVVDDAEHHFVAPMRDKAEKWNIQTLTSLRHMKKTVPELEEILD